MSFATTPTSLANLSHLTPRPVKGLFGDNYLSVADMDFTQQFLPEVYEKEVERYGNRTVGGFLRMVGAEMPMASDRVVWQEQGRLHIAYDSITVDSDGDALTMPSGHLIGAGMTLVVSKGYISHKAYVTSVSGVTVNIAVYDTADANLSTTFDSATDVKVFVYGSEYTKGSKDAGNSMDASFTTFDNKPIILRDKYNVKGSDVAQIGWVEVTSEAGTSGYLWYLKSEHESRLRFEDYLEMSMVEAEKAQTVIAQDAAFGNTATIEGSEGLFAALESRGLIFNDQDFNNTAGLSGLGDFDVILQELDKQGAIEENMMFLDRRTALDIDNMLARANSYGTGGTSYGVFDNSEDMALNLGFSGFRRGSYDFYKTDWKYLNDSATRGSVADVEGVIVPAGTSTVYDQNLGQNISRPFLHVRYRASEAEDRRMKSWVTGSVGGNYTSDADEMNVHFLSERALCVQAANNFVMLKKTQA
tara:strand:+ start:261 stop:1679 length:1419 start_codon:yes stop_codon:yes gene_type:complete